MPVSPMKCFAVREMTRLLPVIVLLGAIESAFAAENEPKAATKTADAKRPNIVVIMADDV